MTENGRLRTKAIALLLSSVFPGLGQLYNRQPAKGIGFLAAGVALSVWIGRVAPADLQALAEPEGRLLALLLVLLALWIWSMIDAWRVTRR